MIKVTKFKLNGEYYIAINEDTVKGFKKNANSELLKEYEAKSLGIKVLYAEIKKQIEYKYIKHENTKYYLFIHISQVDKIKNALRDDIIIEENNKLFYDDVCYKDSHLFKYCKKCGGRILKPNRFNLDISMLCCNGLDIDSIYAICREYPKYVIYNGNEFVQSDKTKYDEFQRFMSENKIAEYKKAFDKLGYVLFTIKNKESETERMEYIKESVLRPKKEIAIYKSIACNEVIDLINEYQMESVIEQILFDKLYNLKTLEIIPQYEIDPYKVDFLIKNKDVSVIVECDGVKYHDIERDIPRQRYLQLQGYNVIRFTGTEILKDVDQCKQDIIDYIRLLHNKKLNTFTQ